jgi:chemotaxis response regulator CheB
MTIQNILLLEENKKFSSFFKKEMEEHFKLNVDFLNPKEYLNLQANSIKPKYELVIMSYKIFLGPEKDMALRIYNELKVDKVFLAVSPVFEIKSAIKTIRDIKFDYSFAKPVKDKDFTLDFLSEILKEFYLEKPKPKKTTTSKNKDQKIPQILNIGSSTGGPQALLDYLSNLDKKVWSNLPILITQHMPEKFTSILAKQIEKVTNIPSFEAKHQMSVENGNIYIAPGGYHMLAVKQNNKTYIKLSDEPQENFCKPSVDPMLRSVARINLYSMVIILTGMGKDGLRGCEYIKTNDSGIILAQDEETSVVWGMPGAIVNAGLADIIGSPKKLANETNQIFRQLT